MSYRILCNQTVPDRKNNPSKRKSSPKRIDQASRKEHTKTKLKPPSPKLNQTSLGEYIKCTQVTEEASKSQYVHSWVASQAAGQPKTSISTPEFPTQDIPMITLTNIDKTKRKSTHLELTTFAIDVLSSSAPAEVDYADSNYNLKSGSTRGKTLDVIDQPSIEVPKYDSKTLNEDLLSQGLKHSKSLLENLAARQRAKSLPVKVSDDVPVPILSKSLTVKMSDDIQVPILDIREHSEQVDRASASTDGNKTDTVAQFANVLMKAKRWKKKSNKIDGKKVVKDGIESVETRQMKRPYVEVPRALRLDILEEAYPIVQNTYQMYRLHLGPKNKLTVMTEQHISHLKVKLGKPE